MRRSTLAALVAMASVHLSSPVPFADLAGVARDKALSDAKLLTSRYGWLIDGNQHPAMLEHKARQRRRARQTHPGKRGRS